MHPDQSRPRPHMHKHKGGAPPQLTEAGHACLHAALATARLAAEGGGTGVRGA